jgi:hypothetical protein
LDFNLVRKRLSLPITATQPKGQERKENDEGTSSKKFVEPASSLARAEVSKRGRLLYEFGKTRVPDKVLSFDWH